MSYYILTMLILFLVFSLLGWVLLLWLERRSGGDRRVKRLFVLGFTAGYFFAFLLGSIALWIGPRIGYAPTVEYPELLCESYCESRDSTED